jgi:ribosomal protein S8
MPSLIKATKPKTPGPPISLHNNPTKTLDISIQNSIKTTVNKSADKLKTNDKRQPDIKTKVIETQNYKEEYKDKDINNKIKEIKFSIKKEYKDKYESEIEKIKKIKEKEIKNYKDKNEKLQQEIDKLKKVEVVLNEKIVTLSKKFEQLKEENLNFELFLSLSYWVRN